MDPSKYEQSIRALCERLRTAHESGDITLDSGLLDADPEVRPAEWLVAVDRVLGQLLEDQRQHRGFQRRFSELLDFACLLANLDFSTRLELHGEYDEMDAVCLALNMLGEELQASTLSRDQVQGIFNAIPDSIIVIGPEGNIELANTATGHIFGCSPGFLNERPIWEVLGMSESHVAELLDEIRRHPIHDREMMYPSSIHPDGIPVSLAAAPIQDAQGGVRAFVWVAKDITHRKSLERDLENARDEALESSRLKGEFLANMSHEIRTPMNGIMGMLELLLDTQLSRSQRELAKTAMDSAYVLLNVLNDILDISKIEAGKLIFESLQFDVQTVIDECIQLLAMRAQQKELSLTGVVLSDASLVVNGDPGRLRQVILNLVTNAIKFTDRGSVQLRVHVLPDDPMASADQVRIRVEVEDTGIGIAPERQAGIFGLFIQADGSTTRIHGGTGLGLAICEQIVRLMHGEIGVRSSPGLGSTFWFTAAFDRVHAPKPIPGPERALRGVHTLFIDAGDASRRILEYYARQWEMRSESVTSGHDALLRLRTAARSGDPFELVLLDMDTPDVDGDILARFIAMDPEIPELQLLLMTPVSYREAEYLSMEGIDMQLSKPVTKRGLQQALTRLMAETGTERDAGPARDRTAKLFERAHILIAEDNPINARVAMHQLAKLGCQVDLAYNGKEAIAALDQRAYDLVFMDCQMPQMDGYEAVRRIRKRSDKMAEIPIVAMTAHALQGEREKCLAVGMNDYLAKPFTSASLVTILKRWLVAENQAVTGSED